MTLGHVNLKKTVWLIPFGKHVFPILVVLEKPKHPQQKMTLQITWSILRAYKGGYPLSGQWFQSITTSNSLRVTSNHIYIYIYIIQFTSHQIVNGSGTRFVFFVWSAFLPIFLTYYLQHFGAGSCHFNCLCNILELEPLISIEFATFWWN